MPDIVLVHHEPVGATDQQLRAFFDERIASREFQASRILIDAIVSRRETRRLRRLVLRKGASYERVHAMPHEEPVLLQDASGSRTYAVEIQSQGGIFAQGGDAYTVYHRANLTRLCPYRSEDVEAGAGINMVIFPSKAILSRMRITYEVDWGCPDGRDCVIDTLGLSLLEGPPDPLFEHLLMYMRQSR